MAESGLRQIDLVAATRLSKSHISGYLSGTHPIGRKSARLLAEALRGAVTWQELVCWEPEGGWPPRNRKARRKRKPRKAATKRKARAA